MMWLIVSLMTGLPLGIVWWALGRLPADRPMVSPWLDDEAGDWRNNAAGLGGR